MARRLYSIRDMVSKVEHRVSSNQGKYTHTVCGESFERVGRDKLPPSHKLRNKSITCLACLARG